MHASSYDMLRDVDSDTDVMDLMKVIVLCRGEVVREYVRDEFRRGVRREA
jgi:hypothetical protein